MAVAGVSPAEIFQTISTISVYGEIQTEAKRIAKEITVMGIDNITALKNAIDMSPSRKFISFLQGMIGTIQSGSDLNSYLTNVSDKYLEDDLIVMTKSEELVEDMYGFTFHKDGKFTERKNSSWCGTPPYVFEDYKGTWEMIDENLYLIEVGYWGGMLTFQIEVFYVDETILKFQYNNNL